jgi:hypothetical protein
MGLVLGQSAAVTLIGIALGLGGAAALTRFLDQLLFGLTALDPPTFIGAGLLFAATATVAALVPAHRATRVDPLYLDQAPDWAEVADRLRHAHELAAPARVRGVKSRTPARARRSPR